MPGWVPRWHPLIWLFVIVVVVGVFREPAQMGQYATSFIGFVIHFVDQVIVALQNIH
jgi:hypothetical protein